MKIAATISRRRAELADRRDNLKYQRATDRAIEALWDMARLEEKWLNPGAVRRLEEAATIAADLADEVRDEIGGAR